MLQKSEKSQPSTEAQHRYKQGWEQRPMAVGVRGVNINSKGHLSHLLKTSCLASSLPTHFSMAVFFRYFSIKTTVTSSDYESKWSKRWPLFGNCHTVRSCVLVFFKVTMAFIKVFFCFFFYPQSKWWWWREPVHSLLSPGSFRVTKKIASLFCPPFPLYLWLLTSKMTALMEYFRIAFPVIFLMTF